VNDEPYPEPSHASPDVITASTEYSRRFSGQIGRWFVATQAEAVQRLLEGLSPGDPVLDVGGGHAQLVPGLVQAGYQVVVFGSPQASRRRLARWLTSGSCTYTSGDLTRLPFPDGSFRAVLSVRQLAHMEDWEDWLGELCRVSGERVIVDYASRRSVNLVARRLFGLKQAVEQSTRPFQVHAPADVGAAFRKAGFQVCAEQPQYFWPMALHRGVRSLPVARILEAPPRWLGLRRLLGSPVVVRADQSGPGGLA
jgi:hypothetical protein